MNIITITCPKCNGQLMIKEGTPKLFCMYCRHEVLIKEDVAETTDAQTINHEFEAKFAIAKHHEALYHRGELTFKEVLNTYDEVKKIGAHHWEYWQARADFFMKQGIIEARRSIDETRQHNAMTFTNRTQQNVSAEKQHQLIFNGDVLASKKAFIDTYVFWMDSAILQADSQMAEDLKKEKEKGTRHINSSLSEVKEHSPHSQQAFIPLNQTPKSMKKTSMNVSFFMAWLLALVGIFIWYFTRSNAQIARLRFGEATIFISLGLLLLFIILGHVFIGMLFDQTNKEDSQVRKISKNAKIVLFVGILTSGLFVYFLLPAPIPAESSGIYFTDQRVRITHYDITFQIPDTIVTFPPNETSTSIAMNFDPEGSSAWALARTPMQYDTSTLVEFVDNWFAGANALASVGPTEEFVNHAGIALMQMTNPVGGGQGVAVFILIDEVVYVFEYRATITHFDTYKPYFLEILNSIELSQQIN